MNLTDKTEEILERLWVELVEHEAEKCDGSILKDDDGLKELVRLNHVEVENNQITLTPKGREEAGNCIRRHRLAERLLVDVLDYRKKLIHETSCKFEHLLHKGLDASICTLLGHPKTCPHGKSIPEGSCCKDAKSIPGRIIMPLTELDINRNAKVSYLQTQDRNMLQKIIAIGVLPNTEITLIQKFPSYVFRLAKSQFAIDKEMASHIYVRET